MTYESGLYEKFHEKRFDGLVSVPTKNEFSYRTLLPYLSRFIQNGKKVLDIGCGNGALSFFAASKGCQVVGIDVSKKAILGCRLNARRFDFRKNLIFQAEDFNNPQFKVTDKFDLVICSEVLEHLKDDFQSLQRINHILKPGGILFLSTPSVNSLIHKFRMLVLKNDYFDDNVGHLRRYELQQLILLLKKLHFKIIEAHKTEGFLRNFFFVTRLGTKLQRLLKPGIRDFVSYLDDQLLFLGESDLVLIVSKPI